MRQRTQPEREPERAREDARNVRVPKIQYRFMKELEETGVGGEARVAALAMADKIKRYPLEPQHVMASWERYTKKAIEEFKAGRGDNAARDRQHVAYAVLFSALQGGRDAGSIGELKQHIEVFSARNPPTASNRQPNQPRQQTLPGHDQPGIERQVESSLAILRSLSPELRASVEASARELLDEGHHTPHTARAALPAAVRDLHGERNERNTVQTLALAVVAKTPTQPELLREIKAFSVDREKELATEARARLERYPADTGVVDVRRDAVAAAVRAVTAPSPEVHREALVLARARDELERVADPRRDHWETVADELARELA